MENTYKDGRFRPITWSRGKDGQEKAETPEWNTVFGDRGSLKMIDKDILRVDTRYQREQSRKKAHRIASEFNWLGFGVLVVSERANGSYFVLDGGHRLLAAMMRQQAIKAVPCLVFTDLSKEEEAAAFVCYNVNRKPPTGVEVFAAQLVADDEKATKVQELLDEYGIKIGVGEKHCRCPQALIRINQKGDEVLRGIIEFATKAWPSEPNRERLGIQAVEGLNSFACQLKPLGFSLMHPEVLEFGKRTSLTELKANGRAFSRSHGVNQYEGFRMAMISAWNRGRRSNKIEYANRDAKGKPGE